MDGKQVKECLLWYAGSVLFTTVIVFLLTTAK